MEAEQRPGSAGNGAGDESVGIRQRQVASRKDESSAGFETELARGTETGRKSMDRGSVVEAEVSMLVSGSPQLPDL